MPKVPPRNAFAQQFAALQHDRERSSTYTDASSSSARASSSSSSSSSSSTFRDRYSPDGNTAGSGGGISNFFVVEVPVPKDQVCVGCCCTSMKIHIACLTASLLFVRSFLLTLHNSTSLRSTHGSREQPPCGKSGSKPTAELTWGASTWHCSRAPSKSTAWLRCPPCCPRQRLVHLHRRHLLWCKCWGTPCCRRKMLVESRCRLSR